MSILNPHKVVEILGRPEQARMPFDHINIDYWFVPAIMSNGNDIYESVVTFETEEDALRLKVEDVFMR